MIFRQFHGCFMFLVVAVGLCLCCIKGFSEEEKFRIGVYMGSLFPNPQELSLTKVFRDLAEHGVDTVYLNQCNYYVWAPRNLHRLAKAYRIDLMVQLFADPVIRQDKNVQYDYIKAAVDYVNSFPDADAVVAWGIGDEVETNSPKEKYTDIAELFQTFANRLRQIDAQRKVTVNHGDLPWYYCGEDIAWSSTFFTIEPNSKRINERVTEARKFGFKNYVVVTSGQGISGLKNADLRWYGFPNEFTEESARNRNVTEDIKDYILTAYKTGAAGIVFFLYEGGENYKLYTLVDSKGNDLDGKWSAFGKVAHDVRVQMGWPQCSLISPNESAEVKISSEITISSQTGNGVKSIVYEASIDEGYTWKMIGTKEKEPFYLTWQPRKTFPLLQLIPKQKCLIRIRAFNGKYFSIYDTVEVILVR